MLIGSQTRFHLCDMIKQIRTAKYSYASELFDQKQTFRPSLYCSEREDLLLVPGRIVTPSISAIWSSSTKNFSFRILLLSRLAALHLAQRYVFVVCTHSVVLVKSSTSAVVPKPHLDAPLPQIRSRSSKSMSARSEARTSKHSPLKPFSNTANALPLNAWTW